MFFTFYSTHSLVFISPLFNISVLSAECSVLMMSKQGMTLVYMVFEHAAIYIQK